MVKLSEFLKDWKEPAAPKAAETPKPMLTKVVCKTPRIPVNKEAAMVIAPAPWWAKPIPPEPDKAVIEYRVALTNRLAELESEVYELKESRSKNLKLIGENKSLKRKLMESLSKAKNLERSLQALQSRLDKVSVENARLSKTIAMIERFNS